MPAKIVISLSVYKMSLGLVRGDRLLNFAQHGHDAAALAALGDLIMRHPATPVHLMVDTVEEEYRAEQLPHVSGTARSEMLKRKLGQLFRTAAFRTCWLQDQVGERRKDDIYVFAALGSGELVRPYLELIQARRAPLAGVYLLPQVTQAVVEKLKFTRGNVLVVARQQAGLRQSFFHNGKLRISRLTPLETTAEGDLCLLASEEVEKSRLFLTNSRILARDAQLTVLVLDPDDACAQLPSLIPDEAAATCHRIDAAALRAAFGRGEWLRSAESLHLFLLGRNRPADSLAAGRLTLDFLTHRLRVGLFAAAGAVVALGLIWSGYNVFASYQNQRAVRQAGGDIVRFRAAYAEAAKLFPAAPASADDMRQAVEAATRLRALAPSPEPAWRAVSGVMNAFPDIELTRLDWQPGPLGRAGEAPQKMEISAEIRHFTGDYRSAIALIDRFVAGLRITPGLADVSVAKMPVDLDPTSTLSGSTRDALDTTERAAQFKVTLSWRPAS